MNKKDLDQQSQHWENSFSNKPEMFGLDQSYSAEKTLSVLKENNLSNIVELGAGLGRDTIFFAKNSIKVTALDYSQNGISIIDKKIKQLNLYSFIRTMKFDVRSSLPFKDNTVEVCYSHMLYCCLLYTSPSPRDRTRSRMPSSA